MIMMMESIKALVCSLLVVVFCWCLIIRENGVEATHKVYSHLQSVPATHVDQKHRTGYHFQPPKHWINDPNGPLYYNGVYHLFYQYNPKGAVWGNIVWAHSISTDLVNWTPLDPAIFPSEPFDIQGCWSGSATVLPGNKPVILYTGIDTQGRQVQNIAYPKNESDPLLKEWVKPSFNPIMVPDGINASSYRDPTTAWYSRGHWNLLVGNKRKKRGMALLYRSRDFKTWTKAKHPLHSSAQTGMWECPDFFPVHKTETVGLDWSVMGDHVKHVLKVSLDLTRFEYYTIGQYFPDKDRYVPENTSPDNSTGLRYDYGNFYASKTFFDESKNRRILWGWANESDTVDQDKAKGWAGIQAIPRTLWLDPSGKQLVQWPIQEIESLRRNEVSMSNIALNKGSPIEVQGVTAAQADVEVTFDLPKLENLEPFDPSWVDAETLCGLKDASVQGTVGPFGLLTLASKQLEEYTGVFFRIFKNGDKPKVLMCSGGARSTLQNPEKFYKPSYGGFVDVDLADRKLSLRSLIDHSVVESFGAGGKTCILSRVYPTLAIGENAHLYVFNNGTETVTLNKLSVWNMDKPKMN